MLKISSQLLTSQLGPNSRDFSTGRRKLKLQVRVSTNDPKNREAPPVVSKIKPKTTRKPRKTGTGVAAALEMDSHPQSTNISSPIQPASRKRKAKNPYVEDEVEAECESDIDGGDYERDGFVTSDDSDEDFEPVREGGRHLTTRRPRTQLGPPITSDGRMVNVNFIHQGVISQFVVDAKRLDEKIRNERGLRKALFTERNLQEMAINWTITVDDMLEIEGIDKDKVQKYGARFLPLVQKYHDNYEAMMAPQEDRDLDLNHQNVIDLVSDEEEEFVEPSKYFPTSGNAPRSGGYDGRTTNAIAGSRTQQPRAQSPNPEPSRPARDPYPGSASTRAGNHLDDGPAGRPYPGSSSARVGSYGGNSSTRGAYPGGTSASGSSYGGHGRGGFKRGSRKGSGGFSKSRSGTGPGGGVSKPKARKKPSNGSSTSAPSNNTFKHFAKKPDSGKGVGGGGGGFGMMPTF